MQTQINFGGFYESIHDNQITDAVACSLGAEDVDTGETIWNDDMDNFSKWGIVREQYSKEYIDKLNDELATCIKFEELDSPQFYNFSTDVIIATIENKDALKLFKFIKDNDLKKQVFDNIRKKTTSVSGYSAFYNYEDLFKQEHRYFLIEALIDEIINYLGEDYPFFVEDFYI